MRSRHAARFGAPGLFSNPTVTKPPVILWRQRQTIASKTCRKKLSPTKSTVVILATAVAATALPSEVASRTMGCQSLRGVLWRHVRTASRGRRSAAHSDRAGHRSVSKSRSRVERWVELWTRMWGSSGRTLSDEARVVVVERATVRPASTKEAVP